MKNLDVKERDSLLRDAEQAVKDGDSAKFVELVGKYCDGAAEEKMADFKELFDAEKAQHDRDVLMQRGEMQLTSEETEFYKEFGQCIKAKDPQQALTNLDKTLPDTVVNRVFEDLRKNHPLLSLVNFTVTNAHVKLLINTNGTNKATWGELCDEIVAEALSGFKLVETGLLKLSGFLPVCKSALELGPEWLDRYVRDVMYEMYANGMEDGIINGDGDDAPIGMIRQVGEGVTVVDGAYPAKETITVNDLSLITMGNLINRVAVDGGHPRMIDSLIMIVNPGDYYAKVMPAMMIMGPDGAYRNIMPYPINVIQSAHVAQGKAVFGLARRYFAAIGSERDGRIEYSDHARYLLDQRVYIIKGFANGLPMGANDFLYLDISNLQPAAYKVVAVDARTPSDDATLSSLKIGSLTLSPAFDPDEDTYTASTTAATNTITVETTDANAVAVITVGGTVVKNGTAATWAAGSNTVLVAVTAEDGTTTESYTVTVTKS